MNRRDSLLPVGAVREWVDNASVLNHGLGTGTGRGVIAMLGMRCFARAGAEPVAIPKAKLKSQQQTHTKQTRGFH